MTSTIDSPPTRIGPPPSDAAPHAPTPTPAPRRRRHAGHVIAIVAGVIALFPAIGLLAGGTALAVGSAVVADDDGYFRYTLERVESDGVAVAATDLWLDDADNESPWVFDLLDVDLRIRAEGAGATDEVFVGVARTADVERYLADADWSEVVELDDRTAVTEERTGEESVVAPTELDIWTDAATGPGEQELEWAARGGRWSVVVMNADGSPGVAADVELGARSGAVTPVAVTMIVVGTVTLAGAILAIVVGARGRRPDVPTPPSLGGAFPPPAPASAADEAVGADRDTEVAR